MAISIMDYYDANNEKQYKIVFTRGDTLILRVNLEKAGVRYSFRQGDVLRFALKENYSDEECIVLKDIYIPEDGVSNPVLRLESEDTKLLQVRKRGYPFDIQLTHDDGIVETVIKGRLHTTEEVE